jgi:threonine dehydratase
LTRHDDLPLRRSGGLGADPPAGPGGDPSASPDGEPSPLVTIDAIRAAAEILRGVTVRTPLVPFGRPERRQWLKAESLQPIGAFKLRGAYVAAASIPPEIRARGLITYSSGNHAQGVARAARLLGVPAVIVMPSDAPDIKRRRVEEDGAQVVVVGTASEERRRVAEELAATRGLSVIPPYDDPRIVAGQGTAGLEIAEAMPEVAAVLLPVGGGGLAAGVAAAMRALVPHVRLVGVEPELAADARDSLAQGRIVRWPAQLVSRTIADGARTQSLGRLTFAHLSAQLDAIVTVSEAEIAAAVRLAAEEARLVVEPSGALPVAAMRFRAAEAGVAGIGGPVVGVVSGGNVDPDRYLEYLRAPVPAEA